MNITEGGELGGGAPDWTGSESTHVRVCAWGDCNTISTCLQKPPREREREVNGSGRRSSPKINDHQAATGQHTHPVQLATGI